MLRSRSSGTRITAVIEKIIASNASEIAEVLVLIAEYEVHHVLLSYPAASAHASDQRDGAVADVDRIICASHDA